MNWLQIWILCWMLPKIVKQGAHKHRITQLFMLVRIYARKEFTEDSYSGLHSFLQECFDDAMTASETDAPEKIL